MFPLPAWPAEDAPADELERAVFLEERGVQVRLELERNPMVAGEPTWATTELTNTGPDDLIWTTDGCQIHVGVAGRLTDLRWWFGVPQRGIAQEFKWWASYGSRMPDDGTMRLEFTPEPFVGMGEFGCADLGVEHRLAPGDSVRSRERWDGLVAHAGPSPTAAAEITAQFDGWRREHEGPNRRRELRVRLPAWVMGSENAPTMSASQAVDFALRDRGFAAWVLAGWIDRWQPIAEFVPADRVWHIGMATKDGATRIAIVDIEMGTTTVVAAVTDGRGEYRITGSAD
ncbi:MAG: hypothetical protein H0W07_01135 [Chloroflexi bacterium]|nr:hypothetical protein [Chloroflexota bacterium]